MQQKESLKKKQDSGFRHRIMTVQSMISLSFDGPHYVVQIIFETLMYFQLLKFPIDYFSQQWFGAQQPVISYTDISYIFRVIFPQLWLYLFYVLVGTMGIYIILIASLFRPFSKTFTKVTCFIIKALFLFFATFGFMPALGFLLNLNSCKLQNPQGSVFWPCKPENDVGQVGLIVGYLIGGIFTLILVAQSLLRFDFIYKNGKLRVIRDSSYTTTLVILYILLNEIINVFLKKDVPAAMMSLSFVLILLTFLLKNEHQIQAFKRIQISCLLVNLVAIILTDCKVFFNAPLQLPLLGLMSLLLIAVAFQFETFGIKFQLENINKWSTSVLRIKYTRTMNLLCRRVIQGSFQQISYIYGYVDVHRQKCQMQMCPYRIPSSEFKDKKPQKCEIQLSLELKRTYGLIKKIYGDGCKISPVNPQLQLNYSIFLQQIGERDLALRNLLMMNYEELSLEKYYKYFVLKQQIYSQICQETDKEFLDLVSELEVKRMESELNRKFEEAALANLEFWSVLNEDHPDFQKLNDIGMNLIKIQNEVRQNYQDICRYAHNERITGVYINYLIAIENDQAVYNAIYSQTKHKFKLGQKIVLQDWSNSSLPTLLVSVEETNHGSIIDINSTCASMLGYEKYQLVNRNCKVLFKQQIRSQLSKFLSLKINQERSFYLIHKNGYLVKVNRKVQNYNSMETGMTLIITLQSTIIPYNTFFLFENTAKKIIGTCSASIAIFGIENKTFDAIPTLKQLLSIQPNKIKQINKSGSCILKHDKIFCEQLKGIQSREFIQEQQFTLNYFDVDDQLSTLEMTLIRHKSLSKLQGKNVANFQFVVQASLNQFKYISQTNQGNSYLRQFSQLSFHSDLQRGQSVKNYAEKISTLRLVDNVIQVIQDDDAFDDSNQRVQGDENEVDFGQKIARKDQEKIFQSKESYNDFVRKQRITMCLPLVLIIGLVLSAATYGVFLWIYQQQSSSTDANFLEMNYQNRVVGILAKEESFMQSYRQHSMLKSNRRLDLIPQRYYKNALQLQQIRLNGSAPFNVPVYINQNKTSEFFSDQFLLSYSNYALDFIKKIQVARTSQQVKTLYNQIDQFLIFYLIKNGQAVREFMERKLAQRERQIKDGLDFQILTQIIMLTSGVFCQILFSLVLLIIIWKIHNKKAEFMKIFLEISELQIMKFSSKTQKFLISLHSEQSSNQIDGGQDNDAKKTSGTFAKKKRFKVMKMDKCVYFKILMIPLVAQIFFLHTFFISFSNLNFMKNSITYIRYSASGDLVFYKGLTALQKEFLGGPPQPDTSIQYLEYYRQYYDSHYITFGNIPLFQDYFTNIFMKNICNGTVTVPQSCTEGKIHKLASNGSLMIFTDITVQTQQRYGKTDFDNLYYTEYQIMSDTHRQLTEQVVIEQKKVIETVQKQLLNAFLIWIFCLLGLGILYGGPVIRKFLDQINYNKDMMTILPISIAKDSPEVNKIMKEFLGE